MGNIKIFSVPPWAITTQHKRDIAYNIESWVSLHEYSISHLWGYHVRSQKLCSFICIHCIPFLPLAMYMKSNGWGVYTPDTPHPPARAPCERPGQQYQRGVSIYRIYLRLIMYINYYQLLARKRRLGDVMGYHIYTGTQQHYMLRLRDRVNICTWACIYRYIRRFQGGVLSCVWAVGMHLDKSQPPTW